MNFFLRLFLIPVVFALATPCFATITLNELCPNPNSGDKEWLEIQNIEASPGRLLGWQLADADGHLFTFDKEIIKPNSFLVLKKIGVVSLNNDADSLRLTDQTNKTIDTVSYLHALRGQSLARGSNQWIWTTSQTPGESNTITEQQYFGTASPAAKTPTKKILTPTTLTGTVTAVPGTLARNTIYVANVAPSSFPKQLRVDLSPDKQADLALGDTIRITGKLGTAAGEPRLVVTTKDSLSIIGHNSTLLAPVLFENLDRKSGSGTLVTVSGSITRKSGRGFDIKTEKNKTLQITLPLGGKTPYPTGTTVTAIGIYRRNNADDRILLRSLDDLTATKLALTTKTSSAKSSLQPSDPPSIAYVITGLGLLLVAAIFLLRRWKQQPKTSLKNSDDLPFEIIDEEDTV